MIFVALYVNDLTLVSRRIDILQDIKQALSDGFEMPDIDQLTFFTGDDIDYDTATEKVTI